jgi:hypothetical protein
MDNISFVRHYKMYREDFYDVLYKSNRLYTYMGEYGNLPKTVRDFIENHNLKTQIDKFYSEEAIYS